MASKKPMSDTDTQATRRGFQQGSSVHLGESLVVTYVDDIILYRISHVPALRKLKKYFGRDGAREVLFCLTEKASDTTHPHALELKNFTKAMGSEAEAREYLKADTNWPKDYIDRIPSPRKREDGAPAGYNDLQHKAIGRIYDAGKFADKKGGKAACAHFIHSLNLGLGNEKGIADSLYRELKRRELKRNDALLVAAYDKCRKMKRYAAKGGHEAAVKSASLSMYKRGIGKSSADNEKKLCGLLDERSKRFALGDAYLKSHGGQ